MARIYAMALELVRHTDGRFDRSQLVRFMAAYQTVAPLTIGELWAWPSMLKLALIENLRRLAEETLEGRASRLNADRYLDQIVEAGAAGPLPRVLETAYVVRLLQRMREYGPLVSPVRAEVEERLATQGMTAEDSIRTEHQAQAMGQVSVGNAITSLRFCTALDWTLYFEQVSLVEQVLQRDPAAVYGSMDFQSRDRYRQAVEELAEPSGEAQLRVALRSVESAREVAERKSADDRAAHVGYHLIGQGRRDLETDVSYQPTVGGRLHRFLFAHATSGLSRCDRAHHHAAARMRGGICAPRRGRRLVGRCHGPAAAAACIGNRHRHRAEAGGAGFASATASAHRFHGRRARAASHDGGDPDPAHERQRRHRTDRAPRGAGAGQQ